RDAEVTEIIVVDDSSTDATVELATALDVRVLHSGGRLGPGGARNVAAPAAVGEVLWFIDADVVVRANAGRVLRQAFRRPDAAAVFGTYDDRPAALNFLSQYKNLVHHHYHRKDGGEAETFWAGCGAIRRDVFLDAGGFDVARYPYPSIEDIELGFRLRQRGLRIVLDPALQGTHLKVWRLANLLHTEIFRRALPWSRLIHSRTGLLDTLNIGRAERWRASLAIGVFASILLASTGLGPSWLPAALLVAAAAANATLLKLFYRRRGLWFAMNALLFHQLYYVYGAAVFVWSWIEYRLSSIRSAIDRSSGSS
ncbi:MAG: glycosyltransferase, partial [Betaproteobacteria bacterium]